MMRLVHIFITMINLDGLLNPSLCINQKIHWRQTSKEKRNRTTLAAMKEAERQKDLETLDMDNFRSFVESL